MKIENYFAIITFLIGLLIAGIGGVLRGDFIGERAAEQVEVRLKEQQKADLAHVMSDLLSIKESLRDLKDELKEMRAERR